MEPRKSTPRNKVYPEGESTLTHRPSSRAPSTGGGTAPEEEHARSDERSAVAALQLDERARTEGRASVRSLLRFYAFRVLPPVATVSVVMFLVFAGLSYAVPNVFCSELAKESSVSGWGGASAGGHTCSTPAMPPPAALECREPSLG